MKTESSEHRELSKELMKNFDPNIIWLPDHQDLELNKKIVKWNKRIEEQAERKMRDRKRIMKIIEVFSEND